MTAKAPTRFSDVAARLMENGYSVVPIMLNEKHPPMRAWQKFVATDQSIVKYANLGCGVLCGAVVGIDIDVADAELVSAIESMARDVLEIETSMPRRTGRAPKVLIPATVAGGEFRKLQTPSYALRATPDAKPSKVEILARGQQFVAFAVHPDTGQPYAWNGGGDLLDVPISLLPTITERQATEIIRRAHELLKAAGSPVIAIGAASKGKAEGERNVKLHKIGIGMAGRGEELEKIVAELLRVNDAECMPPLEEKEVRTIARSVAKSNAAAIAEQVRIGARREAYSHADLAADFLERHGKDVRFVFAMGVWIVWDGSRWRRDDAKNVLALLDAIAHQHAQLARKDPLNGGKAAQRARVARQVESAAHRAGGETIARHAPAVTVPVEMLDVDPHLLNTPGGVIDLRTGEIKEPRREDLITRITAVAPQEQLPKRFLQFMDEITLGDDALVAYLRRALGACLFGANALSGDHWLLFACGRGRNGKNTLFDTVVWLMGEYAKQVPSQVLMADERGNRHLTEIANLHGVRMALSSEINEGSRWAESQIKTLTGDAVLSGRFMRQDLFEFTRTHRHVVLGNHRPLLANVDQAMRERLHLVPFQADFSRSGDPSLPNTLRAEAGGILNWLLGGAAEYWEAGALRKCASVDDATDDYFESQSTFDDWVVERLIRKPGTRTPAGDLYPSFKYWKEQRGEGVPSQTRWGEEMRRRFTPYKSGKVRGYQDIALGPVDLPGSGVYS